MNEIVAIHGTRKGCITTYIADKRAERDMDVVVQPGLRYEELNETLSQKGIPLFFPVDPGPVSLIRPVA